MYVISFRLLCFHAAQLNKGNTVMASCDQNAVMFVTEVLWRSVLESIGTGRVSERVSERQKFFNALLDSSFENRFMVWQNNCTQLYCFVIQLCTKLQSTITRQQITAPNSAPLISSLLSSILSRKCNLAIRPLMVQLGTGLGLVTMTGMWTRLRKTLRLCADALVVLGSETTSSWSNTHL
jgi:hypothetical protein